MRIPFRLLHRSHAATTDALWLAGSDPRRLVAVLGQLNQSSWPEIFSTSGGYIIIPDQSPRIALPATVKLRRLAGNFYLPTDADLSPQLHSDEAVNLTAQRGLVFLPGGPPLAFDLDRPLHAADIVAAEIVQRPAWYALPEPLPRAEHLRIIRYDGPSQPQAILESGGPDRKGDATGRAKHDDLRPASGSLRDQVTARASLGLGKFLAKLGQVLRIERLSRLGAKLTADAVRRVPRLTEKILGRQEAALRELLRRFRAGDIERALRRAPSMRSDATGHADTSSTLGRRNTRYSLRDLLSQLGGQAGAWFGGGEVWSQLDQEYRRVAKDAIARGDYRRAAFIYGVLLRELRTAADTLAAGGLHRDAAILYRDKVNNPSAAARAFEQAGDFDEALRLYRQTNQFDRAGDLLRRLQDEEAAMQMYEIAAERLAGGSPGSRVAGGPSGCLAAGDFLRNHVGRLDLAIPYYESGWRLRPQSVAAGCAERLLDVRLMENDQVPLKTLLNEAEEFFAPPCRAVDAAKFFSRVAQAADRPVPDELADELRDRARMALAMHLRPSASGHVSGSVSAVFGNDAVWPAPLVRDAADAVARARRREPPSPAIISGQPVSDFRTDRLFLGATRAVAQAKGTFDVVVASESGAIICRRAETGRIERISDGHRSLIGLATDANARFVVVLTVDQERGWLKSFFSDSAGRWMCMAERELKGDFAPYQLLSVITREVGEFHTRVQVGGLFAKPLILEFLGTRLLPGASYESNDRGSNVLTIVESEWRWTWVGSEMLVDSLAPRGSESRVSLSWTPVIPSESTLCTTPIDWRMSDNGGFEVVGIANQSDDDVLYFSKYAPLWDQSGSLAVAPATALTRLGYRAAALLGPGRVAAVTGDNRLEWLRPTLAEKRPRLAPFAAATTLPVPARAVAVAANPPADEILVIFADGTSWCGPVPS